MHKLRLGQHLMITWIEELNSYKTISAVKITTTISIFQFPVKMRYFLHTQSLTSIGTTWKVSVFGVILICIFLHLGWMRQSTDQNNSEYEHFLRSDNLQQKERFDEVEFNFFPVMLTNRGKTIFWAVLNHTNDYLDTLNYIENKTSINKQMSQSIKW